jgi:hypothetical protein
MRELAIQVGTRARSGRRPPGFATKLALSSLRCLVAPCCVFVRRFLEPGRFRRHVIDQAVERREHRAAVDQRNRTAEAQPPNSRQSPTRGRPRAIVAASARIAPASPA